MRRLFIMTENAQSNPRHGSPIRAVLLMLALILIVAAGVWLFLRRDAQPRDAAQVAKLREVARLLRASIPEDSTALPRTLLSNITDAQLVYRPVTAGGEELSLDPMGTRALAWYANPAVSGRRAVLLNDLNVYVMPDSRIDLTAQRVQLNSGLDRAQISAVDDPPPAQEESSTEPASSEP